MANIPTRVNDRLTSGLKRFQSVLTTAKTRDINESDTSRIVTDVLSDLFGYDKYSEITSEHAIRGTYCDLAIKVDGKLHLLIEVKAIGLDLKDSHVKQAVDYAANQGMEWVLLTNATLWRVFRVAFTKPINHELVLEFDILGLNARTDNDLQSLYMLCREAITKSLLTDYHAQRQAMNRFTLAAVILSEPVLSVIRRELKRMADGVKVEIEDIRDSLVYEVLKRDVVEGEKALDARKKVNRTLAKVKRAAASTDGDSGAAAESSERTSETNK